MADSKFVNQGIQRENCLEEDKRWCLVFEDNNEGVTQYYDSEADYRTAAYMARIRRSSFGERFTDMEIELVTLLLHIDTHDFPELEVYRDQFIPEYFKLKQQVEKERGVEQPGHQAIEFDDWNRLMATHELKSDLQTLILEGRTSNLRNTQTNGASSKIHPHVRHLLIDFCEKHEIEILRSLMESRWPQLLKHTRGYEHLGKDLSHTFNAWRQFGDADQLEYIMHHIRYQRDNNITRFVDDLTFLITNVYLKLHEGHEDCDDECDYREKMGAKLRALYFYGCLDADVPGTFLRDILEYHIEDVVYWEG